MKKSNIVCIFAHPDDEAFGPSGIIANWASNNDVYIICVTDGSNPNAHIDGLSNIRNDELKVSAEILGVKKVFFLGYCDGELHNNIYHKVTSDIEKILKKIKPEILLTFELKGISGHLDHVFVSMVTTFLYNKLTIIKSLYYSVAQKEISDAFKDYFIYFPDGCKREEVDHIENVSKVWNKKVEAIKAHNSQSKDGNYILSLIEKLPKEEYFLVKQKAA